MDVIILMKEVFNVAFSISLIIMVALTFPKNKEKIKEDDLSTVPKAKGDLIDSIEIVSTLIIGLVGIVLLIFVHKSTIWGVLLIAPISVEFYLEKIANTYDYIGVVGKIVKSNHSEKLTVHDIIAINGICFAVFFLGELIRPERLIDLTVNIQNTILSDFLHILFYVVTIFIYLFLICVVLLLPMVYVSKYILALNRIIWNKTKIYQTFERCISLSEQKGKHKSLVKKYVLANEKNLFIHIFMWLVAPLLFILDVLQIIIILCHSILLNIVGYTVIILKQIKKTIGKVVLWTMGLSSRKVVAILFRISVVVALVISVVINRYYPLGKQIPESTAVLEFMASAIIIPIIFKWINDMRA